MPSKTFISTIAFGLAVAVPVSPVLADETVDGMERTGETVSCLRLSMVRDSDPLDDRTIVFEVRGGGKYVNDLNSRCNGLKREGRYSHRTPQNQICSGHIISVTDSFGNFLGSCALGSFEALSMSQ
ncbi:MAG: hypothetical protein AAGB02_05130 [Pseudomonadota bacterium]